METKADFSFTRPAHHESQGCKAIRREIDAEIDRWTLRGEID